MGRATLILRSAADRSKAADWAWRAQDGTRVEFKSSARTLPQNARMWAMLTRIAEAVVWHGQKLSADDWKDVFTAALRRARVVPGLDHGSFVPIGMRTSDMTKDEMAELMELMSAFAAERGVAMPWDREDTAENPAPRSRDITP